VKGPKPAAPPELLKPPAAVKAEVADPDPKKEAIRLANLGKASFAAGDYGRAAEHFERAAAADPTAALPHFLHGQAKFASGQFADAVASIRAGLALDPKWPLAPFNPVDLYGERPERFVLHLLALKKAVADNPKRATLEFLLGYQLWYTGEKVAADKLFRAAESRLPAPGPIALFKLP
jgi:Flp pilus assembly protein TadD